MTTATPALEAAQQLSGARFIHVRDALVGAYSEWDVLVDLADVALDIDLEVEIGRVGGLKEIASGLLRLTEASGTTEMLLREAAHRRRGNRALRKIAREMGLAPAPFTNVVLRSFAIPLQGRRGLKRGQKARERGWSVELPEDESDLYEAIVRPGGTQKTGQWRRTMIASERSVCQILLDGDPIGTGFLVGPDLVMSNHHVFEMPGSAGQLGALNKYSARFDYRATDENNVVSLGKNVAIDSRAGYQDQSPKIDLDYVIIKLIERTGEDPMPGATQRGWLTLDANRFGAYEPIFVLQHPRGRTLELAVGTIAGWEAARQQEIYEHWSNTDEGSSGSPCFCWKWTLRALHHRVVGKVNRAIAIAAILDRMAAVGTIGLLP